jgi:predicted SnoaL-like aldol condensation-catalyzing enzyme
MTPYLGEAGTGKRWARTELHGMTTSNSTEDNKALVLQGIKGVFIERDPTVQHNPQIPNGPAAIKALLGNLSSDFKYEPGLVMADGDYVSIHGRYTGWGPKPMIAVDVFRVANGKIAEHWDVLQEEVPASRSANGNSMFIGP